MLGRGFSTKKIELIMEEYPDILTSQESLENKKKKLAEVKGMASKSAAHFVDHIPNFMGFLQDTGLQGKLNTRTSSPKPAIDEGHVLFKKTIVMSGTRDKELETDMERVGAILGSSVSSNTFAVITPDLETTSSKVINARKLDIPILTPAEVRSKFLS
jgi:NAD-dependent DNA ligase